MSLPPPQGMTEVDYEAIEAAVTETVRGRWFLNEFARRNRTGEMRVLMEAMARLETRIETRLEGPAAQQALPTADPSIRMLIQRIKEIAGQLDGLSRDMRDDGVESRFVEAVDLQARAVAGMMRGAPQSKPPASVPEKLAAPVEPQPTPSRLTPSIMRMPRANLPAALAPAAPAMPRPEADPRLAALSELDSLPLAKKLAVFS